jgi:hypothetical protein
VLYLASRNVELSLKTAGLNRSAVNEALHYARPICARFFAKYRIVDRHFAPAETTKVFAREDFSDQGAALFRGHVVIGQENHSNRVAAGRWQLNSLSRAFPSEESIWNLEEQAGAISCSCVAT